MGRFTNTRMAYAYNIKRNASFIKIQLDPSFSFLFLFF